MNKDELREFNKNKFIKDSESKWGIGSIDYSLMNYINAKTKVKLRCTKHNIIFEQTPDAHLHNCGCPECQREHSHQIAVDKRKDRNIIEEFKKIHGDKYDYSETNLEESINNDNKVKIICPTHGPFYQNYNAHLRGCGCEKCSGKRYNGQEEFIKLAESLYGNKYGFEHTIYKDASTPILVTCNEHNIDFSVIPLNFLRENHFSCPLCDTRVLDTESFIEKSISLYGEDLYDFSETVYTKSKESVKIKCKICGKIFEVLPDKFLREGVKCPCQRTVWKLETTINNFLLKEFPTNKLIKQQKFPELFLIEGHLLRFDFYLPELKLLIECQGNQHFTPIDFFGGEIRYKEQLDRDKLKYKYCLENDLTLLYFTTKRNYLKYKDQYFSKNLYYDLEELKTKIQNL